MPTVPSHRHPRKDAIFQAIYEDNRALSSGGASRRSPRGRRRTGRAGLGGLLVLLLAAGAWGASNVLASAAPHGREAAAAPVEALDGASAERRDPPRRPASAAGAGLAQLLDLQVRTVVIDAGHGGRDPGAVGPGRLAEKEVALDVALRLSDRLTRRGGLNVLLTREADEAISLKDRVTFANDAGADLFVSIHVNALPDSSLAPIETYFFGADSTTASARALAHAENGGSTFSVAEFNAALRRAGTAVKLQESRTLAQAVQRALILERAVPPHSAADWGAKAAPFNVLLHTEAPAILTEITALSNPVEEARLRTPEYREAIAAALEAGILTYLGRATPTTDALEEDR